MKRLRSLLLLTGIGLRADWLRVVYLTLTVAVTAAAWLALAAMASPFVADNAASASAKTITVKNGRSSQKMLPQHYARTLVDVDGIQRYSYMTLQLVPCADGHTVALNAVGGPNVLADLVGDGVGKDAMRAWRQTRSGVLLSPEDAKACGWDKGTEVSPSTVNRGKSLPLHVNAVMTGDDDSPSYVHYDYINETAPLFPEDTVLSFEVTPDNPRQLERVASHIDKAFAHGDPPVSAFPDTEAKAGMARFGKVQNLLALVMSGIFACCLLVTISAAAHSAAERRRHMAVLQILGYPRWLQLLGHAGEYVLILVGGGALGLLINYFALDALLSLLPGLFSNVHPPSGAYTSLPLWLVVLLAGTLLAPAAVLWRLRPTDSRGG